MVKHTCDPRTDNNQLFEHNREKKVVQALKWGTFTQGVSMVRGFG